MSHKFRWLWVVLALGFALRIFVIAMRPAGAVIHGPDEGHIFGIAFSLAQGDGFALEGNPTAYRDFLFPAVASLIMRVFGESPRHVFYFLALLDAFTAMMLFVLAERRYGENIGLIAAAAWMWYPAAMIFTSLFLTESLFVFFWTAALVLYDRFEDSQYHWKFALALGFVLGLLMLTRFIGILLVISMLIYLVLIRYETPQLPRAKAALIIVGTIFIVVLPWMIRNEKVMHRFVLNTNTGINLLIGNNPNATGAYKWDDSLGQAFNGIWDDENARDKKATLMAEAYIKQYPKEALSLWPKKFAYFWSTDMALLAHYVPNERESLSEHLRRFPIWSLVIAALPYMLLLCFGVAGIFLTPHFPARGLFILQIFLGTLAALMTYGLPRYHFPYMPALLICGLSLIRPAPWTSAPQWRRMFLLTTLGMFGGIWLYEIMTIAGV